MKPFLFFALTVLLINLSYAEPLKIGLVLDKGGKDDKSFNAAAFKGATEAAQKLGVEVKTVESPDDTSYERSLKNLSERGYKLIIAVGFAQTDAVKKIAPQFPNTHFAIVDGVVDAANVAALMFNEHEGSYLVGYLAGLKTKTNVIGFVGGMEVDLIKRFELGYKEGVMAANPKAKILVNYAGVTSDAWMNPTKGKELALAQISQNADIIFTAAGATNTGVFDAIEEKNKLAIGVDSNQNWVKPGKILTSMLKRVDVAVFETIKAEKEGQFKAGKRFFGLTDKGIDYALDQYNQSLISADLKSKIEKVKTDIAKRKVIVSDYYETRKLCPDSPFKCEKYQKAMQGLKPTTK